MDGGVPVVLVSACPINITSWKGIEANAYAKSANGSVVGGPAFNGDVVSTLYPQDGTIPLPKLLLQQRRTFQ